MGDIPAAQVPAAGELTLDHLAHFVPDMERASETLQRLGFTLTPFSEQSHRPQPDAAVVSAGTGNRCIMLERGYLEFLTTTGDTPMATQLRDAMARYIGVHLIAFGTGDAHADHARLEERGYKPLPAVALQRPISTETGQSTARFTVVRVPPGTMAEGRIQYCQHHTPELLWQRRWIQHPNRAAALTQIVIVTANPAEAARRYAHFTGLAAPKDTLTVETARGSLHFIDAATAASVLGAPPASLPWIGGYVLETSDPQAAAQALHEGGVPYEAVGTGVLRVVLPEALGGVLFFTPPGNRLSF